MKHEFIKIESTNETRYVLESASAGATGAGSIASVSGTVGGVQKRNKDNILAQEADKKIEPVVPRNFVAKNAKMGGAGAHRDKKKEQKQGKEKHRKPFDMAESLITALPKVLYHGSSNPIEKFNIPPHGVYFSPHIEWAKNYGNVITSARVDANKIYLIDYKNKIDEAIMDALFDRNYETVAKFIKKLQAKGYQAMQSVSDSEMVVVFPGTSIQILNKEKAVAEVSKGTLDRYVSKAVDSHGHADFSARMSKYDPNLRSYHTDQTRTAEKRRQGISRALDRLTKESTITELEKKTLQSYKSKALNDIDSAAKDIKGKNAKTVDANKVKNRVKGVQSANDRLKKESSELTALDPDVFEDLDNRFIARIAKRIVPSIKARSTPEGYVHLMTDDGLDLMIGGNVADGSIDINIGSTPMTMSSSGVHQGAVSAIIKAVYDAAVKKYGQPENPGTLNIDHDASHGAWQHIANKLGLQYGAHQVKEEAEDSDRGSTGISKDKETKFHAKLDKLVHNTFGKRKGEMEDRDHPDHEISMASNELLSIADNAKHLLDLVRRYSEMEGLEAWQQSKITKAADYLNSVLNSLKGEEEFDTEDHTGFDKGWGQGSYDTYAGGNHGRGVAEGNDEYMESLAQSLEAAINEKAVSKAQQRFMGMVHAAKKGEKPASPEVAKVAKGMSSKEAEKYASTKHKGLPEKKPKK